MRPGDRRTKTMDRDPNTESKAQRLAELPSLSLPDNIHTTGSSIYMYDQYWCQYKRVKATSREIERSMPEMSRRL